MSASESEPSLDFIRTIVAEDLKNNKHERIITRFPPEPNGYLHIGHAKSICLNFGISLESKGVCHLRFDDTNPTKEDTEYVNSIKEDVKWLGFDWGENLFYASDYFDKLYGYAVELVKKGKAYVCSLSAEETKDYRGNLKEPGKNSPYRDRSVEENLELLKKMKAGECAEGEHILRAKIDMTSPNLNMRDPAIYRIRKAHHHRTGDTWCIYPMYDFAHGLSDAIEKITHSICTLEFENHRPLYEWFLEQLDVPSEPKQIEFARLNLTYTLMSKRKLLDLVNSGVVNGWDDPRMPTIAGIRRRGYTPKSLRRFCEKIGISKHDSVTELNLLEYCVREDLNETTPRVMGILNPLKVVIENYPEGEVEEMEAPYHPKDESMGKRKLPFSREIYIEQEDFMEDPPKKFFRLAVGREVRLRYAYVIYCEEAIKNEKGEVVELRCKYDVDTRSGSGQVKRKVKGTIHWLSAAHAIKAEARLYETLFLSENAEEGEDYRENLNPNSLKVAECYIEPSLKDAEVGKSYQFERNAYFCVDKDSTPEKRVFNRTVTLKDGWGKIKNK